MKSTIPAEPRCRLFFPRQRTKSQALLQNSSRVVLVGHPEVILRPARARSCQGEFQEPFLVQSAEEVTSSRLAFTNKFFKVPG